MDNWKLLCFAAAEKQVLRQYFDVFRGQVVIRYDCISKKEAMSKASGVLKKKLQRCFIERYEDVRRRLVG